MLMVKDHVLLPALIKNSTNIFVKRAKDTYEKMGITALGNFDGNFIWVKLPKGWRMVDTEYDYDILLDNTGEVRGKIIYEDVNRAIFKEVK